MHSSGSSVASVKSTWKRVEIKVQAEEEEEIRETHGREQGEEKAENKQSLRRMTHGWDEEVYCLHPRRLQQIAISCKRNLLQQTIFF